jgi:hypothetical protein
MKAAPSEIPFPTTTNCSRKKGVMSGWDNSHSAPQSSVDWSEGNVENNSYSNDRQSQGRSNDRGPPSARMNRGPPRSAPRYNGGGYGGNNYESGGRPPPSNYKWASSKKRYEWKPSPDDENAIAPKDEELEKELFGEDSHVHTGLNFDKYDSIPSSVRGDNPPAPVDQVIETPFFLQRCSPNII